MAVELTSNILLRYRLAQKCKMLLKTDYWQFLTLTDYLLSEL